ncbi:hypothetical protein [Flavobacterium sp.]|uniref:hypothetical protein n=1 Tax=Flavobacterium sp. TaxID=239 RepID=UPI0037521B15
MKNFIFIIGLLSFGFGSFAQTYQFQTVKDIDANSVISQDNTVKDGFIYRSVSLVKLKSISVLLHKDGLTKASKSKLSL